MFPLSVRIIIVTLCFSASGYRFYEGKESWVLYLIAGVLFAYEHFKSGTIWLAFWAFRQGKPEWVRRFLRETVNPNWLRPSSKCSYYFLKAVVNTIDKDLVTAKNNLLLSIELPFATEHMRCYAHCFLSEVFLDLGDLTEGKKYFELSKNIQHRPELDPLLEKTDQRIKAMA